MKLKSVNLWLFYFHVYLSHSWRLMKTVLWNVVNISASLGVDSTQMFEFKLPNCFQPTSLPKLPVGFTDIPQRNFYLIKLTLEPTQTRSVPMTAFPRLPTLLISTSLIELKLHDWANLGMAQKLEYSARVFRNTFFLPKATRLFN